MICQEGLMPIRKDAAAAKRESGCWPCNRRAGVCFGARRVQRRGHPWGGCVGVLVPVRRLACYRACGCACATCRTASCNAIKNMRHAFLTRMPDSLATPVWLDGGAGADVFFLLGCLVLFFGRGFFASSPTSRSRGMGVGGSTEVASGR